MWIYPFGTHYVKSPIYMYQSHSWKSASCSWVECQTLACGVKQNILLHLISQQGKLAGIVCVVVIQDLGLPGACDRELHLLHTQSAGPLARCGGDSGSGRWWPRHEPRGDRVGADSSGRGEGGTDGICTSAWRLGDRQWDMSQVDLQLGYLRILEISWKKTVITSRNVSWWFAKHSCQRSERIWP